MVKKFQEVVGSFSLGFAISDSLCLEGGGNILHWNPHISRSEILCSSLKGTIAFTVF